MSLRRNTTFGTHTLTWHSRGTHFRTFGAKGDECQFMILEYDHRWQEVRKAEGKSEGGLRNVREMKR